MLMKILFQGDSITDAFRKPDEFNPAFQAGNGYVFLIASRLGRDFPDQDFVFINRGVSGNTIQCLAKRWVPDAVDLSPDVLSLLIGVNDTVRAVKGKGEGTGLEFFVDTYRDLLAASRKANPKIRFLLLEPFLVPAGSVTSEWLDCLAPRRAAVEKIANEYGAVFVPLQKLFDEALQAAPAAYWAFDGIHATHAGFQLIADAWLEAAGPVLFPDG